MLERFHKELLREERQIADDALALAELPNILRRWHQGFEGKTHISRSTLAYGPQPDLDTRAAIRESITEYRSRNSARSSVANLNFKIGDRVKILSHATHKKDPQTRIATIKRIRVGTLTVVFEDTSECQDINVREVVQIIPAKPALDAAAEATPQLGEVILTIVGKKPRFLLVTRLASDKVLAQVLKPTEATSRYGIRKRKYLPEFMTEVDGGFLSDDPPANSSKKQIWVGHEKILAIGKRAQSGLLSASLTAAFTQHTKK